MTTLELRIFGLPMLVEVPQHRLESLRAQWSWCVPEAGAQRTILGLGGTPVVPELNPDPPLLRRPDLDEDEAGHVADYRLTTALTATAISACSGQLLMFHAAGVSDQNSGRVAGLIAPSGTGKTTAAGTLCSSGMFGYVTDETLVLNDDGAVLPYPKPLSVVVAGSPDRQKSQHGPEELEFLLPPAGDLTLGPLVLLDRVSEASPPKLTSLSVIDGLKAVLPQSSAVPLIPNCLDTIAELARRGGGFHQLTYSEIAEAPAELLRAFEAPVTERDWLHVSGTWPTGADAPSRYGHLSATPTESPLRPASVLVRAPFVDAIVTADRSEALVLIGDLPMHLRGLGAQSWQYLDSPHTVEEILAHCVEVFGEHPEARTLVLDALTQLEEGGVVVRVTESAGEPGRPTDR